MNETIYTYTGEDFPHCPWCGTRIDAPEDPGWDPEEEWRGECRQCGSSHLYQYEEEAQ